MMFFYGYSERPCWPLCPVAEDGLIYETPIELGFFKWDVTDNETMKYFYRLEFDENENPIWTKYSREQKWLVAPQTNYDKIHFPNGMLLGLSSSFTFYNKEEGETELDVFIRTMNEFVPDLLKQALKLTIATKRFKSIIENNPDIPTIDFNNE